MVSTLHCTINARMDLTIISNKITLKSGCISSNFFDVSKFINIFYVTHFIDRAACLELIKIDSNINPSRFIQK